MQALSPGVSVGEAARTLWSHTLNSICLKSFAAALTPLRPLQPPDRWKLILISTIWALSFVIFVGINEPTEHNFEWQFKKNNPFLFKPFLHILVDQNAKRGEMWRQFYSCYLFTTLTWKNKKAIIFNTVLLWKDIIWIEQFWW